MTPFNVFSQDIFSAVQLSTAIDKISYIPNYLSTLPGLFVPDPVRTEVIWIEERDNVATILPFSPRGTPPTQEAGDTRKARAFNTQRYANASRITASELFGIRQFGSEVSLKTAAEEVARRQAKLLNNAQLTREYHMLNCVTQAKVLDKDATVVYDWATEFEQTIPAEVDWDLDNASPATGVVLKACRLARRTIQQGLKGVGTANRIIGLCGDTFYEQLCTHSEVRNTYLNWQAAADLRTSAREWSTFTYGDIDFVNYRSTDSDATATNVVAVTATQCKFFPLGAGIFRMAYSPGERFEHLGQMGQEFYSAMVMDDERNSWADVEIYSYPLPVCTMPQALYQARNT